MASINKIKYSDIIGVKPNSEEYNDLMNFCERYLTVFEKNKGKSLEDFGAEEFVSLFISLNANNYSIREFNKIPFGESEVNELIYFIQNYLEVMNPEALKIFNILQRKIEYVFSVYETPISRTTILDIYKENVLLFEKIKNKDLCYFTGVEVIEVVKSVPTTSYSKKSDVFSFIKQYMTWAVAIKDLISINACDGLDRDEIIKLNKRAIKEKLVSKDEFFARCEKLLLIEDNIFTIIPLILARFGITGNKYEYILNLRWEDCDRENKVVRIVDHETGELITTIDIEDDRFFMWIDRAKATDYYSVDIRNVPQDRKLIDYGYVLKKIEDYNKSDEKKENFNAIYQRLMLIFKLADKENSGVPKMTMNDLVKSRRIELLLNIRENRKISTTDIKNMLERLDPKNYSNGKYNNIMKTYESVTGDVVLGGRSIDLQLIDKNSKGTTDKIREDIGLM